MTPILVFDIETIPDVAGIRRVNDLPAALSDGAVMDWFSQKRRAATGSDFAPHHLQQVVAIGCALRWTSTSPTSWSWPTSCSTTTTLRTWPPTSTHTA